MCFFYVKILYMKEVNKKDLILKSAQSCFIKYGYKRTTLDDIAKEANISRAAIYLIFSNKEDLFSSLLEYLHNNLLEKIKNYFLKNNGLEKKLINFFYTKSEMFFELANNSNHGKEILDASSHLFYGTMQKCNNDFLGLIISELDNSVNHKEIDISNLSVTTQDLAKTIISSANGIKNDSVNFKEYKNKISILIKIFITSVTD